MVVHVPLRFLFIERLVAACTFKQNHNRNSNILVKLTERSYITRTFCTSPVRSNENEEASVDSSHLKLTFTQGLPSRRRRPLSPLERISNLLPKDVLSPEVMQLREEKLQEPNGEAAVQVSDSDCIKLENGPDRVPKGENLDPHHAAEETPASSCLEEEQVTPSLPGETLLSFGELLIAEYRKKKQLEFKIMFQLQDRARLQSSWGVIPHDHLVGQPAGCFQNTNKGVPIFIRRASLEDFVLYMKRGPAIAYPKDAATMLMMMDVMEGDCVLESGSGSGAMSLFLSRAVGAKGSVLSVEVREDHYRRAVKNYKNWRSSWALRRGREWPDNVWFENIDLCTASSVLAGRGFHSIALDMVNPYLALPTVFPHLHPGGVCAVYIPNITQVVDLLEGLRCSALQFLCERIIEVPVRDWVVNPALKKDGQYCTRKAPNLDECLRQKNETSDEAEEDGFGPSFGSVPYIARPHPEQISHTAFLVKLRKFVN